MFHTISAFNQAIVSQVRPVLTALSFTRLVGLSREKTLFFSLFFLFSLCLQQCLRIKDKCTCSLTRNPVAGIKHVLNLFKGIRYVVTRSFRLENGCHFICRRHVRLYSQKIRKLLLHSTQSLFDVASINYFDSFPPLALDNVTTDCSWNLMDIYKGGIDFLIFSSARKPIIIRPKMSIWVLMTHLDCFYIHQDFSSGVCH